MTKKEKLEEKKISSSPKTSEGIRSFAFEDSPIISVKPYIRRADSMPNACVPDLTWRESSTWKK